MKGKNFLLNFVVNIKKRFFFTNHERGQVNKCIYEYFYFEEKIFNIIDHPDIKHLLLVDYKKKEKYESVKKDNINSSNNNVSKDNIIGTNNMNEDTDKLLKNKKDDFNFNLEKEDNEIKDIICDKKFDDNLKNVINNHICNYINSSSKYFIHLCIYYIYNNEKSKFVKLLQKFNNYCFSYEDLFILFYLICRINYKDTQIIHNMLHVFEIYYYKLDNFFSYKISNIFFSPHNNLHTAINNLPLVYKVKLINMDVYYVDQKERIKCSSNNITEHSKETINTYIANSNNVVTNKSNNNTSNNNDSNNNNSNNSSKNIMNNNNNNNNNNNSSSSSSEYTNYKGILNHNNVTNKGVVHTENILKNSKLTNNNIENVNNDYLEKIDENNAELELQNLDDVDMESYEKKISKDSVKYITINTKKERQKIKSRERKYEGLKLKSALLTQIRNYIEEENINKDISTYKYISQNSVHNIITYQNNNNNNNKNNNDSNFIFHNNYIDKKNFEIKELLTIFIHDKELAEKNHYIKDFIHIIINYFIMNKNMIHTNFILLILFMNKINYYNNKKLNKCIQDVLMSYIKSMNLNEQDIYDFINNKKKKSNNLECKENIIQKNNDEHKPLTNKILNEQYNILELLYNQQYTYNFTLYDENNYYDDNFQYIVYRLLKNYFYLVSYMMTLPFIQWNILKSYINSFHMFINIFKENTNISSSLHISDISFMCAIFIKTKIMEHQIIQTLFNILNGHLDHYLIIQEKKNIYNQTKEEQIQYVNNIPNVEPNINDLLTFLHFLYFFKQSQYNDLLIKILIISFNKFILLNDTQQLIFYNTIEGIRKNQNGQNNMNKLNSILNYFNYDQNINHFLKRNKNIQKQSLGMLFC
ncbi:conserved Plasmodium protein, unknown function [Plasmodium reichenowi]|uniref:Uncharacterized protein n=1 Tax=Plasmodium reichenowi TaxID=5854 RepID=A0A2P9D937_PLARE|nr:conserved Plasmodium protein, unknown function [Plasmodium reichenowi]